MTEQSDQKEYAGFWIRLASVCIDALVIAIIVTLGIALVTKIVYSSYSSEGYLRFTVFFLFGISFLITIIYFTWFNAKGRQSPGKRVFGIVVLDDALHPISLSKSFWRAVVYFFDYIVFCIGHILIFFNKRKKALHDLAAKTVVVRTKPANKLEPMFIIVTLIAFYFLGQLPASYIRENYVQAFRIPTGSLKPTLLAGDYVLADKYSPTSPTPEQGDWVVFKFPRDENLTYIKRCIACSGQTVEVRDGSVYVDGQPEGQIKEISTVYDSEEGRTVKNLEVNLLNDKRYLIRRYLDVEMSGSTFGPVTVPQNSYFVLGDNRDNSADSRQWGFVPQSNIIGKAAYIYFSWDQSKSAVRWSRIGKIVQ